MSCPSCPSRASPPGLTSSSVFFHCFGWETAVRVSQTLPQGNARCWLSLFTGNSFVTNAQSNGKHFFFGLLNLLTKARTVEMSKSGDGLASHVPCLFGAMSAALRGSRVQDGPSQDGRQGHLCRCRAVIMRLGLCVLTGPAEDGCALGSCPQCSGPLSTCEPAGHPWPGGHLLDAPVLTQGAATQSSEVLREALRGPTCLHHS